MKQGNLEKWTDVSSCKNLLFFSELVNELLFDYSIPSNRISTLNSHYLCLDALNAIDGIDNHGVPEGTLKPIMEELYSALQKDVAFDFENDSPLRYFVKYQNERYRISNSVSELSFLELKNAALALNSHFFVDNKYYTSLKEKIKKIVLENKEDEQPMLFRLVKSLLTELVNVGYSTKYIHDVMDRLFWSPRAIVTSPSQINSFFEAFTFQKEDYTVVFVVDKARMKKFVDVIDDLTLESTCDKLTDSSVERIFCRWEKSKHILSLSGKH